jgi:hypothetical protein
LDSRLNIKNDVTNATHGYNYKKLKDDEIVIYDDVDDLTSDRCQEIFKQIIQELISRLGEDYIAQSIAFAMHNDQIDKTDNKEWWIMHIHRLFFAE